MALEPDEDAEESKPEVPEQVLDSVDEAVEGEFASEEELQDALEG